MSTWRVGTRVCGDGVGVYALWWTRCIMKKKCLGRFGFDVQWAILCRFGGVRMVYIVDLTVYHLQV